MVFAAAPLLSAVNRVGEGVRLLKSEVVGDAVRMTVTGNWAGQPAWHLLTSGLSLPDRYVGQLFRAGRVHIGAATAAPASVAKAGQAVWLRGGVIALSKRDQGVGSPAGAAQDLPLAPAVALYVDDHAIVVNKPASLLVHAGTLADADTLDGRVAAYDVLQGDVRMERHVHRLDRDTTGVLLYARHEYAARSFDRLLNDRRVGRTYVALVRGRPPAQAGLLDAPIGRDRHVSGRWRVSASTGRPASTKYRTLATRSTGQGTATLIACRLHTGRTHQVRVHLASIGCPVLGDTLYGGAVASPWHYAGQLALHALRLTFWHPYQDQQVTVQAPPPDDMVAAAEALQLVADWARIWPDGERAESCE